MRRELFRTQWTRVGWAIAAWLLWALVLAAALGELALGASPFGDIVCFSSETSASGKPDWSWIPPGMNCRWDSHTDEPSWYRVLTLSLLVLCPVMWRLGRRTPLVRTTRLELWGDDAHKAAIVAFALGHVVPRHGMELELNTEDDHRTQESAAAMRAAVDAAHYQRAGEVIGFRGPSDAEIDVFSSAAVFSASAEAFVARIDGGGSLALDLTDGGVGALVLTASELDQFERTFEVTGD